MANTDNTPESTSAAASIKKAKAESATSPAEPLSTLRVRNKNAGETDDPRLASTGSGSADDRLRTPKGDKIEETGTNTPARAARDALPTTNAGDAGEAEKRENRTPTANKSGKPVGATKKYVVRKTEIFAYDPELAETRKFGVGEVVELAKEDAKHFDELGVIGPFLDDDSETSADDETQGAADAEDAEDAATEK